MVLFDSLEDKYYHGGFDNLYNPTMFCCAAYNHPKKVNHSVTIKGGCGISSCVQQEEMKTRTSVQKVWGTVKVAKLEGDPDCLCLVASCVYNTKLVHYLSIISNKIDFMVKEKYVFNVETNKTETMRFI